MAIHSKECAINTADILATCNCGAHVVEALSDSSSLPMGLGLFNMLATFYIRASMYSPNDLAVCATMWEKNKPLPTDAEDEREAHKLIARVLEIFMNSDENGNVRG